MDEEKKKKYLIQLLDKSNSKVFFKLIEKKISKKIYCVF